MTTQTAIEPVLNGKQINLSEGMKKAEWKKVGKQLSKLERGVQWAVGDWVNYGVVHYNDGLNEATEILAHLGPDTIVKYADVAAAFDDTRRRDNLEFSHHRAVMSLARVQQDMLLDEASTLEYTVREIEQRRNEIRTGVKDAGSELSGGMTREELEAERERVKERAVSHRRTLWSAWRKTGEKSAEVRVPRDVFEELILPKFKEPKADAIEVSSR